LTVVPYLLNCLIFLGDETTRTTTLVIVYSLLPTLVFIGVAVACVKRYLNGFIWFTTFFIRVVWLHSDNKFQRSVKHNVHFCYNEQ